MRILTTTLSIILILFSLSAIGQNLSANAIDFPKEVRNKNHKIGLAIALNRDISLAYRNKRSNNFYLRTNLNTKTNSTFIDAILTDFSATISLSAGLEKHISIGEKFNAYFGAETKINSLIYGYKIRRNTYSFVGLTGINFQANNNISFFTEAQFGMILSTAVQSQRVLWVARNTRDFNFGILYTIS